MKDRKPARKDRKKEVRYFDPPDTLRRKAGAGGIPPAILDQAEEVIDNNKLDFVPYAEDILKGLRKEIKAAKSRETAGKEEIETLTGYIMELKANGGMFSYNLVSEIAGVVLNFLEEVDELNKHGFDIIEVHQRTLEAIIKNKLTGGGGREGRALARELTDACKRYRKRYGMHDETPEDE